MKKKLLWVALAWLARQRRTLTSQENGPNVRILPVLASVLAVAVAVEAVLGQRAANESRALVAESRALLGESRSLLAEQQQIHGRLDIVPDLEPEGLFVRAQYKNESARAVHLWMLGVRIFKANGFVAGATVRSKPELLLHSESSIDECPEAICPVGGKSLDKVYAHNRSGGMVSLAPGGVHQELLGPYPISEADLGAGIWLQGFAYPRESDDDVCVIVEMPSVPGAFPRICEQSRKNEPECWTSAKCPYERAEIRFQVGYATKYGGGSR